MFLRAVCFALLAIGCSGAPAAESEAPLVAAQTYPEDTVQVEPVRLPALSVCLYDVSAGDDVLAGVAAWAEALKPWRDVVISDANCNITIFEVGQHAGVCAGDDAAGCTRQIGGLEQADPNLEVFLYRGNYEPIATGTVMHEMGHLLGLTHTEAGLMNPKMDHEWTSPDDATLERLSKILHVDLAR